MRCSQCHNEIQEGARFCSHCGAKVSAQEYAPAAKEKMVCPSCHSVFDMDCVYCDQCGHLLQVKRAAGKELQHMYMISKYDGEPTVGIAKATGDLIIFDDRVEFRRKLGNAAGALFGAAGMAFAAMKEPAVEVYRMEEITAVRMGKYGGVMPTLVLQLSDGRKFTFCGLADGNTVRTAISNIEQNR